MKGRFKGVFRRELLPCIRLFLPCELCPMYREDSKYKCLNYNLYLPPNCYTGHYVADWQPLPEPPKDGEQNV